MSINSILGSALSGLNASQAGLRQTSNNIANINTQGYARTQVPIITRNVAGQSLGVTQSEVQRITDRFLLGASLSASSDASSWQARSSVLDRIQSQFGTLDNPGSVFSRLNQAFADIGTAAQDPASGVRRLEAVNSVRELFEEFGRLDREIRISRSEVQQQINGSVDQINQLIKEIQTLNSDITRGRISGDSTGAENRQAALINDLSELIDVRIDRNDLGSASIRTQDGVLLLGATALTLQYSTGSSGAPGVNYSRILATTPTGASIDLQDHLSGGSLHGLLALRDTELSEMALELAEFAAGAADALNQAHAEAISVPAPGLITGRNTGLLGTDASNFTGKTTIALTDPDGLLVRRVDVDFTAGTLSVDSGPAQALGGTINSLTTALDNAFGATAAVTFSGGSLSFDAAGSNGIGFLQDAATPSDRAGRSFSSFFGTNELVSSGNPAFFATGISGTDAHGFTAGETLQFKVTASDGRAAADISVNIAGASFNDILTALNDPATGLGRFVTFSLDSDGRLSSTPVIGTEGYSVDLATDTTQRVGSNVSFSQLFGLGEGAKAGRASGFSLRSDILRNPDLLALGRLEIAAATVAGDFVAGKGDGRGGFAIQRALETARQFQSAGSLSAASSTLTDFSGRFAVTTGTRAANAEREATAALSLSAEADLRRANVEGVNIDEELANMTLFQQSYNAAARLIQAARELNDTLLSII
ncbi:MAG: flagellar hook-associated protein FlaN [Robiginitomaculum sp.]|nr:MAG: flagellar hook-associated protein FlaN [Robiginitomaculum sp.]